MTLKAKAGIVLVDPRDQHAVRNVDNVLTLYQLMINENKAEEGTAKFLVPGYVQHNPLIPDGSIALGKYFAGVKATHPSAHAWASSGLSACPSARRLRRRSTSSPSGVAWTS